MLTFLLIDPKFIEGQRRQQLDVGTDMKHIYLGLKTSFCLFSISLFVLLLLTSCNNELTTPDPPIKVELSPGDPSEKLLARIYFDASASMQGFVVPNTSQYKSILRPLESVITSGWRNGKAEFYRFGEQVTPIDRDGYLMADSEDFYTELKTYIQKIFEYEEQLVSKNINNASNNSIDGGPSPNKVNDIREEDSLVVIVTDLFQDKQDVNLLVTQLRDKYINKEKKGQALGLLGLRSEFDGRVYNLGTSPILYRSTPGKPETFRPFYLLVIGRHADIAHYFDRLIANGFTDAQTLIFSQYLVDSLLSFENATIEQLVNLNRVSIAEKPDPQVKEYRITDKNKPSQISAKLKFQFLSYVMPFDSEKFEVNIIAEYKPDSKGKNEISLDAQKCLKVISTHSKNDEDNELNVGFNLDSGSLPDERKIYLYEVTLSPGIDTFKEPDWCSQWDMEDERNGAKTLNLVNFIRGLSQATTLIHEPIIAKFHFYIEKR